MHPRERSGTLRMSITNPDGAKPFVEAAVETYYKRLDSERSVYDEWVVLFSFAEKSDD